jgi:hypothetical protein
MVYMSNKAEEFLKRLNTDPEFTQYKKKIALKEREKSSSLFPRLLNFLIIGWSITWAIGLFSLVNVKVPMSGSSIIYLLAYGKPSERFMSYKDLIFWTPFYIFGIWAIGCALILTVYWLVARFKNSNG